MISYKHEYDIHTFSRSVDSPFLLVDPEFLVFGIRISDYAQLN